MSGVLAPQWLLQALTDAGAVASGARLFSYIAGGGNVPTPIYADKALTTPLANPYVFTSAGRGSFWLDPAITYRLRLETAGGTLIDERDGVEGAAGMAELANNTDPSQGAGLIGIYGSDLRTYLDKMLNILQFIPADQWAGVSAGTSSFDCADAIEDAIAAAGTAFTTGAAIYFPKGSYRLYRGVIVNKNVAFVGDNGQTLYGGAQIQRRGDFVAFDCRFDGIDTPAEDYMQAPSFRNISFRDTPVPGTAKWTEPFLKFRMTSQGIIENCVASLEGSGAWMWHQRTQDMRIHNCYIRGGGEEWGDQAQVYFAPSKISASGADDNCNEILFTQCTFEWAPGVQTRNNPETGLPQTTYKNRAVRSDRRVGSSSYNNSIRFVSCKLENITGQGFNGQTNSKSNVYLDGTTGFQFEGCTYNQTNRVFEIKNSRNFSITGVANNYGSWTVAPWFAKVESSDGIDIAVQGYACGPIILGDGCTRIIRADAVSNSDDGTVIASTGELVQENSNYIGAVARLFNSGTTEIDYRFPCMLNIVSRECDDSSTYFTPILSFRPSYTTRHRNGMTLRFRASATLPASELLVGYNSSPTTIRIPGDGVTDTLEVPQYYPTDPDNPSRVTISVAIQNRLTGASTAATIVTKNDESNPLGGSIVVTPVATADEDYVVSRGYINKAIVDTSVIGGMSTDAKWFSVVIPPGVLRLENLTIDIRTGSFAPGLFYKIHEFELREGGVSGVAPFYPAKVADAGPGQPPNESGGWDCGWEPGAFVEADATSSKSPHLMGWECTSTSAFGGVGSFVEVWADRETTIVNTGTTSYTLPDPATQVVGAKRRYINNGSATITITAFAGDSFAKCNQTVLSLGVGESVLLEYTATNVWSIVDGLVSMAEIVFTGDAGQSVATATTAKITAFNVNASASINCTADQANDKLTTTREGLYQIDARLSWYTSVITNYTISIFVDGALVGVSAVEYFGATGSATSQVESVALSVRTRIAAGKDIDLRIAHSDAGSVTVGVVRASLAARRIS